MDVMNFVYCSNCGYQNDHTASFCQACKEQLNIQGSIRNDDDQASFHSWSERNKFENFIGHTQDYYYQKWIINDGKLEKWGFNWIAFFLGIIWFGYRKMYIWMFGIFIIELLLIIIFWIAMFGGFGTIFYISFFTIPILRLLLGMFANKMYFHHVQEKVNKIELQSTTTADFINALKNKGNTSGLVSLLAFILSSTLYLLGLTMIFVFVTSLLYD